MPVVTPESARAAIERFGPGAVRLVPAGLRPRLAELHRPVARYVAGAKYRRKYGGHFETRIHPDDDLLHYSFDVAHTRRPAFRYFEGVRMYFEGGEWNAAEVDKVLRDAGISLRDAGSMLEFACGWGRVTRHFVHLIDPARITVADITRSGVDFVRETFGVRGFYSTTSAGDLDHDGSYDLIVVISLFSHLPPDHWGPWLARLGELLRPGGAVALSTLGMHAYDVNLTPADRATYRAVAEDFFYREQNETRGRLEGSDYGLAYVGEGYVRESAAAHFPGELVAAVPRALNGFQDMYVLRRASA